MEHLAQQRMKKKQYLRDSQLLRLMPGAERAKTSANFRPKKRNHLARPRPKRPDPLLLRQSAQSLNRARLKGRRRDRVRDRNERRPCGRPPKLVRSETGAIALPLFRFTGVQGHVDGKARSFVGTALNAHPAIVLIHDFLHHGKANAQAARCASAT